MTKTHTGILRWKDIKIYGKLYVRKFSDIAICRFFCNGTYSDFNFRSGDKISFYFDGPHKLIPHHINGAADYFYYHSDKRYYLKGKNFNTEEEYWNA